MKPFALDTDQHYKTWPLQWLCTLDIGWPCEMFHKIRPPPTPSTPSQNTAGWAWISSLRFVDLSGNARIGNEGVDLLADELPFWQQASSGTKHMESKTQRLMESCVCVVRVVIGYCKAAETWFSGGLTYERSFRFLPAAIHSSIGLSWNSENLHRSACFESTEVVV